MFIIEFCIWLCNDYMTNLNLSYYSQKQKLLILQKQKLLVLDKLLVLK